MDELDMALEVEIEDRLPLDVITVEDRRTSVCDNYDDSTTYTIKRYGLSLQKIVKIVEKKEKVTIRHVAEWGSCQYASFDRLSLH